MPANSCADCGDIKILIFPKHVCPSRPPNIPEPMKPKTCIPIIAGVIIAWVVTMTMLTSWSAKPEEMDSINRVADLEAKVLALGENLKVNAARHSSSNSDIRVAALDEKVLALGKHQDAARHSHPNSNIRVAALEEKVLALGENLDAAHHATHTAALSPQNTKESIGAHPEADLTPNEVRIEDAIGAASKAAALSESKVLKALGSSAESGDSKAEAKGRPPPLSIGKILDTLEASGSTMNKWAINIGANDGKENDPLYALYTQKGYQGVIIEGDAGFKNALHQHLRDPGHHIKITFVDPENIMSLLKEAPRDQIDVFKIDIDCWDCHVLETVLANGLAPHLFWMEINILYPPGTFAVQRWSPLAPPNSYDYRKKPASVRCSLSFINALMDKYGYMFLQLFQEGPGGGIDAAFVRKQQWTLFESGPGWQRTSSEWWWWDNFVIKDWEKLKVRGFDHTITDLHEKDLVPKLYHRYATSILKGLSNSLYHPAVVSTQEHHQVVCRALSGDSKLKALGSSAESADSKAEAK